MRNVYLDTFEFPRVNQNSGAWIERHIAAIYGPQPGFEHALVELFSGWLRYADAHKSRYESGIGADGVLGPEWSKIGGALRGLFNGETGRFDCGLLDSLIANTLRAEGFDPEQL